jgi:hypothetical protein
LNPRIQKIIRESPHILPETGFGGTGGPGMYLQILLGLQVDNRDIPDSMGWEVKTYSRRTNFITLFHKEPHPQGVVKYLVKQFGWLDSQGRKSFRHTIAGNSDRFTVLGGAGKIIVSPKESSDGPIPYWTEDDILGAAGAKLRRLLLVRYLKSGKEITYDQAFIFETLTLSRFIEQVNNGTVKIDFDAREMKPGSNTLRNHGTKFRVSPNDIQKLYATTEQIY